MWNMCGTREQERSGLSRNHFHRTNDFPGEPGSCEIPAIGLVPMVVQTCWSSQQQTQFTLHPAHTPARAFASESKSSSFTLSIPEHLLMDHRALDELLDFQNDLPLMECLRVLQKNHVKKDRENKQGGPGLALDHKRELRG